jgi:hypothetical protein
VPSNGGPVIASPVLVPITYQDDTNRATLEAHAVWMAGSTWLTTVGAEYGVGAASILGNGELSSNAPMTLNDSQLQSNLAGWIMGGSVPRPAGGSFDSVLYMVYLPSHTTMTGPGSAAGCSDFDAYHQEMNMSGIHVSYEVILACPTSTPGLNDLQQEELAAAHELIEAATDPFPNTNPGWIFPSNAASPWAVIGGEVADLCAQPRQVYSEGQNYAQRVWSNAAAASGTQDPCIPAGSEAYYGVTSAVGGSGTAGMQLKFMLDGWSTAPVSNWNLNVGPGPGTFRPTLALDLHSLNNGGHAMLTVTIPAGTPGGGVAVVFVQSSFSMTDYHLWPLLIETR